MFRALLFSGLLLFAGFLSAQGSDEDLAAQYFDNKEYAKALPLYQQLADRDAENMSLYERYLSCLIETKGFDKAIKFTKKRYKKFSENPQYGVDLGFVYEKAEKPKEAEKAYNDVIANLKRDYSSYARTAAAFQRRMKYDYAIKTFEKGDKVFDGMAEFSAQLAQLYLITGDRVRGIEKYVGLVINSGLPFEQSQHLFEMNVTDSADFAALKIILLKYIQKMPENNSLAELLNWAFIKQKDWDGAYVQTRALDKRLKEQGLRMIDLGELCMSNEAWGVAARCFSYARDFGKDAPYYQEAVSGLLETRYNQLVSGSAITPTELLALELDFSNFIKDRGYSDQTWRATSRLASLYIQYVHTPEKAIDLLEEFVKTPGVGRRTQANAKLLLGDAYVTDDDVWTSELLYAQVEKDFEEDPLGQEAKFRRARLSYFRGDFAWAKVQLEVLKGATTQLIANNAIELALTISENLGIDSNYDALEMYANADLLRMQNKLEESEKLLDSIPKKYPGHSLSDDILYARAQIRELQGRYAEAADLYETLAIAFNHDILADNAWYKLGLLYENKLHETTKAMDAFKKIVLDFPGSLYNVDARKHYRKLRGDNVDGI